MPVPLNYRLAPPEWSYIVKDAGREAADRAAASSRRDRCRPRASSTGCKRWVAIGGGAAGWEAWRGGIAGRRRTTRPERHRRATRRPLPDVHERHDGAAEGRRADPRAPSARNIQQISVSLAAGRRASAYLIVAPVYHAAAAMVIFRRRARRAASLHIMEDFDPGRGRAGALRGAASTSRSLVPAMIQVCLDAVPDVAERRYDDPPLDRLRRVADRRAEMLRRALEVFGCDFMQGYGMTETTAGDDVPAAEGPRARAAREAASSSSRAGVRCWAPRCAWSTRRTATLPVGQIGEILLPRPAADARLLEPARGDGGGAARRLDAHRRRRAPSTRRATSTSRTASRT